MVERGGIAFLTRYFTRTEHSQRKEKKREKCFWTPVNAQLMHFTFYTVGISGYKFAPGDK